MVTEDKMLPRELKLISEKLDYLIDKVEYTSEILDALVNITLDPPPEDTPEELDKEDKSNEEGVYAIDPGAIRPCVFKYVYIWLENGNSFWVWLTYVGRRSAAGWRWTGRRWVYFGIDLDCIEAFECF